MSPLILKRRHATCPHCGERIVLVLDLSADEQSYIEDCEVCCGPMEVRFRVEDGVVTSMEVRQA